VNPHADGFTASARKVGNNENYAGLTSRFGTMPKIPSVAPQLTRTLFFNRRKTSNEPAD